MDVYTPAAELVKGKEHWLYFVHPETPAAGAEVAVYFNNNVSDILRYCAISLALPQYTPIQQRCIDASFVVEQVL